MSRKDAIYKAVQDFNSHHRDWSEDDMRPVVDSQYDMAVDEMLSVINAGDVPLACLGVVGAVQEFVLAWPDYFAEASDHTYERRRHRKTEEHIWGLREGIERAASQKDKPAPKHEDIETLSKQGVPTTQIARMWGIECWQVEAYLRKSWKLPPNHKRPGEIEAEQKAKAELGDIQRQLRVAQIAAEHEESLAPESLDELLHSGVTAEQICRMRPHDQPDITIEQVMEKAADLGITLPPPGDVFSGPNQERKETEELQQRQAEAILEGMKVETNVEELDLSEGSLESLVVQLHSDAQGTLDSSTVAKQLSSKGDHGEVTHQKVSAIVRSWKKSQEQEQKQHA